MTAVGAFLDVDESLASAPGAPGVSCVSPEVDGVGGPGIPAEDADAGFEYGYTTRDEGTGFGLSIVRTIAESHGWSGGLDEDFSDGTRFVFRNVEVRASADGGESIAHPGPAVDAPRPD